MAAAQASDEAEEDDSMALVKRVQVAHEKLLARGIKTYVGIPCPRLSAGLRSTVHLKVQFEL